MSKTTIRKSLIVGNWKMHFNTHQASLLVHKLSEKVPIHQDVQVVLCPSTMSLQPLSLQINHRQFKLGAQNCYWRDEGAYTGEVSATMLRGLVDYVIVGHSERRHVFGESDRDIRHKVQAAYRNGLNPILCVGETAMERADGETPHVLHDQVVSGLLNVTSQEIHDLTIAYEPVWAIGSGQTVEPKDLRNATKLIRKQIHALYGEKAADAVKILYGGSVDSENCDTFLNVDGVDGLLVGGASLKADAFASIVEKAHNSRKQKG
jgi:triosephosphate isomerase